MYQAQALSEWGSTSLRVQIPMARPVMLMPRRAMPSVPFWCIALTRFDLWTSSPRMSGFSRDFTGFLCDPLSVVQSLGWVKIWPCSQPLAGHAADSWHFFCLGTGCTTHWWVDEHCGCGYDMIWYDIINLQKELVSWAIGDAVIPKYLLHEWYHPSEHASFEDPLDGELACVSHISNFVPWNFLKEPAQPVLQFGA